MLADFEIRLLQGPSLFLVSSMLGGGSPQCVLHLASLAPYGAIADSRMSEAPKHLFFVLSVSLSVYIYILYTCVCLCECLYVGVRAYMFVLFLFEGSLFQRKTKAEQLQFWVSTLCVQNGVLPWRTLRLFCPVCVFICKRYYVSYKYRRTCLVKSIYVLAGE